MINPFSPGYLSEIELRAAGFKGVGSNVRISKNCTIMGLENIILGSNVRIDGYCSIFATGSEILQIGSFVHIGSYCLLSAGAGMVLEDFSGLSQRVSIYSRTDDYTGQYLTNPTVPEKYTGATSGRVTLGRHVIVGSGTVILPNVTIAEGSSVGALSLVTKSLPEWGVYTGCPARRLKDRSRNLLDLEAQLIREMKVSTASAQ